MKSKVRKTKEEIDAYGLTDEQRLVMKYHIQDMTLREKLLALDAQGHKMEKTHYYDVLNSILSKADVRLEDFATKDLVKSQMETIDTFREIKKEHWSRYKSAVADTKDGIASMILEKITVLETFIKVAESDASIVLGKQMELKIQLAMKIKAEKESKRGKKLH